MTITMYQSDRNFVTPANDASLYSALGGDTSGVLKRGNMLKMTVSGLTVTVNTGQVLVLGRLIEVQSPVSFTLPPSTSGSVVIVVDLSKNNTISGSAGQPDYSVTVNQVYLAGVTGALTKDDINNGGFLYELPIGTFTSTATTATVKQTNPILNDTGWQDLDISSVGAKFNTRENAHNTYAQYRVRDNVVFLRWRGVDLSGAVNGNQLARVPWEFRPDVEIAGAGVDMTNNTPTSTVAFVNDSATLWIFASSGNQFEVGSLSYPLPM